MRKHLSTWITAAVLATTGATYLHSAEASGAASPLGGSSPFSAAVADRLRPVAVRQAPAAPKYLYARGGNGKVTLIWFMSRRATSYNVFRGTAPGGQSTTPIATNVVRPYFTDSAVTNGTTYYYKVAAVNQHGVSELSNEASAKPSADANPMAPELKAKAGDTQIALTWTTVVGAAGYNVYRGATSGGQGSSPIASNLATPAFTDKGLTNGKTYFYKVAAIVGGVVGAKSNEASATPGATTTPPPAPASLAAVAGNAQIVLTWAASTGATSYNVYRGTTANGQSATPVKTGVTGTTWTNTGLTNGTKYFYKVSAVNANGSGAMSPEANATPSAPAVPPAPATLTATAGNAQVILNWAASTGATSYNVYRGTSANGESTTPVMTGVTGVTWTNTGLTNGKNYFFKVAAVNANGTGAMSPEANATPVAPTPPPAPTNLVATAGNQQIVLTWTASSGATSYNIYRGTTAGGQSATPLATGITAATWTNTGLTNGTMYFYKVAAVNANGTSAKSNESNAAATAPGVQLTAAQKAAFQFLRQSTFGPNPALVDQVVQMGKAAFLDAQFALPPSPYPDILITTPNMELVSEQFMQNALTGQDQLRQRVAWALSQIFVVSATKVNNTHAMVPYIRMLEQNAFGNVKDIMRDVSLSPAMGEFLDMVNNNKGTATTTPNENYAREWLQLFSIGLHELNDNGTPQGGSLTPTFSQSTIADLSRALTGWTYGDANATDPTGKNPRYYDGPMKPVAQFHDTGAKMILGQAFPAGQTARQDFDQALNVVFNHHNVGPFLVRQLIQKLVMSNPRPAYMQDVVAVFNDNGQGVRGDLRAVVRAILLHAEAANGTATSGKLAEPALFVLNVCRVICGTVADHPFLTDFTESMSQRIWFAPSVFNYFSPNFRAGGLFAPEFQIWTAATAMIRTNFVASLVSGGFGSNVTLNLAPFQNTAGDPNALVDTVDSHLMGGTMPSQMRQAILTALGATTSTTERVRTALYLAATAMQYQVEH